MANQEEQPAGDGEEKLFKVTVYLTRANILKLEELRLTRMRQGQRRVDRSSLIREAIDQLG